jgi:AcrR family transcriptional regulator
MPKTPTRTEPGKPRRRGQPLNQAILEAAWTELCQAGYAGLTIDAVASRAGTSKPVLYRRWPSRAALVLAALRHGLPGRDTAPDTGELRCDLLAVLRGLEERFHQIGTDAMRGLLTTLSAEPDFAEQVAEHLDQTDLQHTLRSVLERAADRGEINTARITPRIISLPMDLLRNEHLLRGAPVPDATIVEIVDEIVLPLLRAP